MLVTNPKNLYLTVRGDAKNKAGEALSYYTEGSESAQLLYWTITYVCLFFAFSSKFWARSQLGLLLWRDTRQEAEIKEWGGTVCEGHRSQGRSQDSSH